jgi:hypothetical protein
VKDAAKDLNERGDEVAGMQLAFIRMMEAAIPEVEPQPKIKLNFKRKYSKEEVKDMNQDGSE